MKEIETGTIIHAPASVVWEVLTDFENYHSWNPFIKKISGQKKAGGKLSVDIQPPGSKSMVFKPEVLVFEEEKELRWLGKLLVKGLFDGEHYFLLKSTDGKSTEFIHGEIFRGLLPGFMSNVLENSRQGFLMMNEALKRVCEERVSD